MSINYPSEEVSLMKRIEKRDQSALTELESKYRPLLYSMAMQVLQDTALAEEVTQEVFFQVWQWPERWDSAKGRLSNWLLSATRYTAIDHLRREKRLQRQNGPSLDKLSEILGRRDHFDDPSYDDGNLIRLLLQQLSAEQRQVVDLAYFHGMTHSEIADQLHLPIGTIKSRLRLALEKLKDGWFEAIQSVGLDKTSRD